MGSWGEGACVRIESGGNQVLAYAWLGSIDQQQKYFKPYDNRISGGVNAKRFQIKNT